MNARCLLFPQVSIISEAILLLNPLYFDSRNDKIQEFLTKRMGFDIIHTRNRTLSGLDAEDLFSDRFSDEPDSAQAMIRHFSDRRTCFYFVAKTAGLLELNPIFKDEDPALEDILIP